MLRSLPSQIAASEYTYCKICQWKHLKARLYIQNNTKLFILSRANRFQIQNALLLAVTHPFHLKDQLIVPLTRLNVFLIIVIIMFTHYLKNAVILICEILQIIDQDRVSRRVEYLPI